MKQDGYTLMELLAIIILLSVVAITTTPMVIRSIHNSQKKTFKSSVLGIVRAIHNAQSDVEYESMDYTIHDGDVVDSKGNKLDISVKEKVNGVASINEFGRVSIVVNNGTWCGKTDVDYDIQVTNYKSATCK